MQQVILKNSVLSWWQKAGKIAVRVLIYALLVFGSVLIVFPFLWMLLSSFKTPLDANALDFSPTIPSCSRAPISPLSMRSSTPFWWR